MKDILLEYIELLSFMSEINESRTLYGLDQKRKDIHDRISKALETEIPGFIPDRLDMILHNLDKVINLELPLQRHDSSKVCAEELYRAIVWYGKYFLTDHVQRYKIPYVDDYLYSDEWDGSLNK